jgi:hypothetical protein
MRSGYCLIALILAAAPLHGADAKTDKVKIDDEVKKVTANALEWLAGKQASDGSWSDGGNNSTAMTGFTLMAFMSQGHVPNQGKYGPEVAKGSRYLMAAQNESGLIIGSRVVGNGFMYSHGVATLALSQLWGMTGDKEVKKSLKRAVDLIVNCQHQDGGWRYQPVKYGDSDISVTIIQVMALRGAKDSGINVPDKTMIRALKYINACHDNSTDGYTYQPGNRQPGFARTAAGICVLKLLGEMEFYDEEKQRKVKTIDEYGKKIDNSVKYLKASMKNPREHFWYGHYYACHAMHQVGGKDWEDYYTTIKKEFPRMQAKDGSWSHFQPGSTGPVYQTAIAVIALSIPANYLPIFQR